MNKGREESFSDFSPSRKAAWAVCCCQLSLQGRCSYSSFSTEEVLKILDPKGVSRTAVGRAATAWAEESWKSTAGQAGPHRSYLEQYKYQYEQSLGWQIFSSSGLHTKPCVLVYVCDPRAGSQRPDDH